MRYEFGDSQAELAASTLSFTKGGKWSRRTSLEKVLIVLGVLLVLGLVALAIALGYAVAYKKDSDVLEICDSKECAQAAARILSSLDMSVNPCENFYDFACGAWRRRNVIPEDRSGINVFGILRDEVEVIMKYLLEVENRASDLSVFKTVRDMYRSCVNEDLIEKRNISVAIPLLEELGGWPVLGNQSGGNWNESTFDLIQLLVGLKNYGYSPLIRMYVFSDVKESNKRIIYLDQPGYGISSRSYLVEPKYEDRRQAYKKMAVSMAVYFGANLSVAETDMQRVLEFEIAIANITMKPEDRRDNEKLYNKMSVYDLSKNITEPSTSDRIQFNWLHYIESVMNLPNVSIPINDSEPVVVRAPPYFQKMFAVFQMYDKRTIANYLVWRMMQTMNFNLPKRFKDLSIDYDEVVYGTSTPRARWRDCAGYVNGQMGMAVGRLFIEETFDEAAKSSALAMIRDIREAFDEILQELDWLDNKTRTVAEEKASAIRGWIGYPDVLTNDTILESVYESVTANRDTHFENNLNNLQRSAVGGLNNLREEFNKNVWTTPPATVNAFYHSLLNVIMFPAGILQPPFYARDQPKSMNYGGIGVVIGHEITHGFDDVGRQYDKDGDLQQWWTNDVIDRFKMKAQCIIDQYGSYLLPEANMTLNGINTQGENIADNGGLKQSFRAYRRWVEKRGKEELRLPGLNYNHNQLFFINFAQLFCENLRQQEGIDRILTDPHSLGRFRVIGTLQNSREFAETFGCKKTDYMNPNKKCNVW
ncbi:hypothetical protein CHS0354_016391 [Potamilus streckersoni]|uniref:Neprilysin n=1 Tax=Potamilus streckersoni TaxID=2493646 RepID=A0AAE0W2X9_9BIVA|nr:hypothetical protein CHS0354_016391 [Potamilus streckersoni]